LDLLQIIVSGMLLSLFGIVLTRMTHNLRTDLTGEVRGSRADLKGEIGEFRTDVRELRTEMRELRSDVTHIALAVGARPRADQA
jgi:hypothetical protein